MYYLVYGARFLGLHIYQTCQIVLLRIQSNRLKILKSYSCTEHVDSFLIP